MRANVPNIFEGHEGFFYIFFALIFLGVVGALFIAYLVLSYLFRTFYPKPKLVDNVPINDMPTSADEKSRT
jgi:hypothetical protein